MFLAVGGLLLQGDILSLRSHMCTMLSAMRRLGQQGGILRACMHTLFQGCGKTELQGDILKTHMRALFLGYGDAEAARRHP